MPRLATSPTAEIEPKKVNFAFVNYNLRYYFGFSKLLLNVENKLILADANHAQVEHFLPDLLKIAQKVMLGYSEKLYSTVTLLQNWCLTEVAKYNNFTLEIIQIRSTEAGGTKLIQVETSATSLNSNDAFLLKDRSNGYVWVGLGANDDEIEAAKYGAGWPIA